MLRELTANFVDNDDDDDDYEDIDEVDVLVRLPAGCLEGLDLDLVDRFERLEGFIRLEGLAEDFDGLEARLDEWRADLGDLEAARLDESRDDLDV